MNISDNTIQEVKKVAEDWQKKIQVSREPDEEKFHDMMQKMLKEPENKIFLIELLDQSFRAKDPSRVADQLEYIFAKYENTSFFSNFEKLLIWAFRNLGIYVSSISVPLFISYLRNDISAIVVKGEEKALIDHIEKRRAEGTRVNLNIIGETVLGEREAQERLDKYVEALSKDYVDYLSIKISTLFSQITPVAYDWTVDQLVERLEKIYDAAVVNSFTNAQGEKEYKFVNLDMEEYRDLRMTVDVFKKTLEMDKFKDLHAGIVIQAYLPDSFIYVKELTEWAKNRVENGGAPIKIRLVKGANQEMEMTEASLRGWECVTYMKKAESDANFKVIMNYLISEDVSPYVHIGIASHNLFDHALGMLLAKERNVEKYYTAEMLEGMSESAYKVLKEFGLNILLYAPIATKETFTNAIAYLVRRFDENTADQNFLRYSFGLEVGTEAWNTLVKSYDDSIAIVDTIAQTAYRTQDRNLEFVAEEIDVDTYVYESAPDTDFTLEANQIWAEKIKEKWQNIGANGGFNANPVIAGEEYATDDEVVVSDNSQYHDGVKVGTFTRAKEADIEKALKVAVADPDGWRDLSVNDRQLALMKVAQEFERSRADLIGIAAAELGKVFSETDVEVSEAIDFLNFYPYSVKKVNELNGVEKTTGKGVGLVVSPWNFPIAIPTGGVAAALAAGNTVIIKPSSDAVLSGYAICKCFWDAGISKNALQFVPTSGKLAGENLVAKDDVAFTIFTGGEDTAYEMIKTRPNMEISAETGGKDATIVTELSDHDQAAKNVVASAFNNSGQKCSATSLLVLEKGMYEDETFKEMLVDATKSLNVGPVWDLNNRISTLASKPSGNLEKSLTHLDDGESWLIKPEYADNGNPYMLKPAIRWGTKNGDFCHMNELFGPVLSVMCADDIDHAIELVNATGYGLTSGIESLDEREKEKFKNGILAGNLYLNRMTTGAIVTRQPFGGMRKSAIGSGKKAGGYNYVSQFMNIECTDSAVEVETSSSQVGLFGKVCPDKTLYADEITKATKLASHFAYWYDKEFTQDHDYTNIRGESNIIRYLPVKSVLLCIEENDDLTEILTTIMAIKMVGSELHISLPKDSKRAEFLWLENAKHVALEKNDSVRRDDEESRVNFMSKVQRVRYLQEENVSIDIYKKVAPKAMYIASTPFMPNGRIELMHYFIEQSISDSYHRYGNLGLKGLQDNKGK
ncbi:Proline dehydrogenase (Proline oxidase) / Delta-1-pyrroline-5-carboxylate dehydrogenase [hydrothermal vent metagenome]|uniref:L-glutamate gamma-semialdehyde dehydrogenase n=1 Tax=hydrothermal vent metagenome TaxID=652676 RepID=A0A1W1EFW0_9ZZZZ